MNPTVYIETSIVSYLTATPSKDIVVLANQEVTRLWWQKRKADFTLRTSQFVIDEAGEGDPAAAAERLRALAGIDLALVTPEVFDLGNSLLRGGALPPKARIDALHVAVAAVNGIDFLMTWNCRHIANAALWHKIKSICRSAACDMPGIVTPYELLGENP
jgi:hypothetical protein